MIDQDIKNFVRQEIQASKAQDRFQLQPVQRHTHAGGADGPPVFQPAFTYVGLIGSTGEVLLLPKGWSVTYDSTGVYFITHNLGTILYGCVASAAQSTNIYAVPVIEGFENEVDFSWADVATAAKADTGFFFSLTIVGNKPAQPPQYYGAYTS